MVIYSRETETFHQIDKCNIEYVLTTQKDSNTLMIILYELLKITTNIRYLYKLFYTSESNALLS